MCTRDYDWLQDCTHYHEQAETTLANAPTSLSVHGMDAVLTCVSLASVAGAQHSSWPRRRLASCQIHDGRKSIGPFVRGIRRGLGLRRLRAAFAQRSHSNRAGTNFAAGSTMTSRPSTTLPDIAFLWDLSKQITQKGLQD